MNCPCCDQENLPGADICTACQSSLTQAEVPVAEAKSRIARSLKEDTVSCLEPVQRPILTEDVPLEEAVRIMRKERICCLLVTDADGRLTGHLSVSNLIDKLVIEGESPGSCTVGQAMHRSPETLRPDCLLAYALYCMSVTNCRYIPLVGEDGQPQGLISTRHVIQHINRVTGICG